MRLERSLSRALVKSPEQLILLQGDPGSGKSVALRFVSRQMAERARYTKRLDTVIPLYINLKNLKREGRVVNSQLIEDYVLETLQADSNRDIHRFLDAEFSRGKERGTWFFLFDSFDEIPEVLSATEVTDTVRSYSDAIFDFVHGMSKCRGVIASRYFRAPPRWGLPTFRIVPLSERRKQELIRKADLGPAEVTLLADLPSASPDVVALSGNPLFLGLLAEYARAKGQLPSGWHDVFEAFVSHRLETDDERVTEIFGIDAEELRIRSEEIAFTMTATEGLGLSPARSELKEAYTRAGFESVDRLEASLDALEWIKLARAERKDGSQSLTFTFSHRRFQEYFATCVVLREPERIAPRRLLTDASWRETTVTLCQAYSDRTDQILAATTSLLEEATGKSLDGEAHEFDWPPGVLHLLSLLQSAFAGRTAELPDPLHEQITEVFETVDKRGTITDRKWVLEVSGIARPNELARRLGAAFRDRSDWLREVAYRQSARLGSIPDALNADIRVALVERTADLRLQRDWPATRAQLMRLGSAELIRIARLLRAMPSIDGAAVLVTFTSLILTQGWGLIESMITSCLAVVFAVLYFPCAASIAAGGRLVGREARSPTWHAFFGPADRYVARYAGLARLSIVFVLWPSTGMSFWVWLFVVYLLTWTLAATYACAHMPPVTRLGWLIVHLRLLRRLGSFVRQVTGALRDPWLLAGAGVSVAIGIGLTRLPDIGWVVLVVTYCVGVGTYFLIAELRPMFADYRWRRRWAAAGVGEISPEDLFDALADLRQPSSMVWFLDEVRTKRLMPGSNEARLALRDILRAMDILNVGEKDSGFEPRSEAFPQWVAANSRERSRAVIGLRDGVPDGLGRLLEELERRRELPVA